MKYVISFAFLQATASLLPPKVGIGWKNGWVKEWRAEVPGLTVSDTSTEVSDELTKVVRRWTWNGSAPLEQVVLAVRYRMKGDSAVLKPFIPGILMYGNPSNKGRTDGRVPVFAGEPGEFAIFEEHRIPMPFAILENAESGAYAGLHTLPSPVPAASICTMPSSIGAISRSAGADARPLAEMGVTLTGL